MITPRTITVVLAAGQEKDVPVKGKYVHVRSCSVVSFQASFDADILETFYPGMTYPSPEIFSKIRFKDSLGAGCTIEVVVGLEPFFVDVSYDQALLTAISNKLIDIDDNTSVADVLETPAAMVALPVVPFLIDNAAAVNVGGGVVGIPVTGQPFATGEQITIANTINYNGNYAVLASSGANQVDITAAFVAETFDGVNDSIGLVTPRSIAANTSRRELELHNHNTLATGMLYFGDVNIDPENNRGIPILAGDGELVTNQAKLYFACLSSIGKTGVTFSYAEHEKA